MESPKSRVGSSSSTVRKTPFGPSLSSNKTVLIPPKSGALKANSDGAPAADSVVQDCTVPVGASVYRGTSDGSNCVEKRGGQTTPSQLRWPSSVNLDFTASSYWDFET